MNKGTFELRDIHHLRKLFPDAKADHENFCLFSTSGVHGTYTTIEQLFMDDGEGGEIDKITVLVIRPRLAQVISGHIKVERSDLEYLRELRASSLMEVARIGIETTKKMSVQDLSFGEYVMRRRSSDKEPQWILTRINETYLQLIKEFPEDYRIPLPGEII